MDDTVAEVGVHVCCESCMQDIEQGYCEILDSHVCCCKGPEL